MNNPLFSLIPPYFPFLLLAVYQPRNPTGYKKLLTWKQAGEIYCRAKSFVAASLEENKDRRLINHIVDSARSVQRNIEEGFKRATTKEYVEFLGFSRGSLEELKGDFEELKREFEEGIRVEKGKEGKDKGGEGIRGDKGKEGLKEIRGLLDLIYGEDCMLGRQIDSLEKKMADEKTLPRNEMIKSAWKKSTSGEKRFWKKAGERFGVEKGWRRVNKGGEGKEKGIDKGE